MQDNNFNQACPSGNIMVDSVDNHPDPDFYNYYIKDKDHLRRFLRANSYKVRQIRSILRQFNEDGFIEIEK